MRIGRTGFLVVDVQNAVGRGCPRARRSNREYRQPRGKGRQEEVPVVWVRHADDDLVMGSDDWQIVPELEPSKTEVIVEKHYGDSFEDTTLETVLLESGIGHLIVVGAQTDACIRSTLHGALVRGYDVTLVGDAHTTEDNTSSGAPVPDQVIAHTNLYWSYQTAPGRIASVVETKTVGPRTRCESPSPHHLPGG